MPPAPEEKKPLAPPVDLAALREILRTTLARGTPPEAVAAVQALVDGALTLDTKEARYDAYVSLRKALVHRDATVVRAGIAGFGRLRVAKSSRELLRFFDPPNGGVRNWVTATVAVDAWGQIHDAASHEDLWDLIKVPSHEPARRALAVTAARALAGYKDVPKPLRYAMLDDFMAGFRTAFDTSTSLFFPSAAAGHWWGSDHLPLVESFNQLVATQHTSYEECEAWWRKHRKEIQAGKR